MAPLGPPCPGGQDASFSSRLSVGTQQMASCCQSEVQHKWQEKQSRRELKGLFSLCVLAGRGEEVSAVAYGGLVRPGCEHLCVCGSAGSPRRVSACAPLPRVTGLCFGMCDPWTSLCPTSSSGGTNVTSSGCEIWGLVCSGSGVCGQGYQTCLCQLGLPAWDPGWGVHTC